MEEICHLYVLLIGNQPQLLRKTTAYPILDNGKARETSMFNCRIFLPIEKALKKLPKALSLHIQKELALLKIGQLTGCTNLMSSTRVPQQLNSKQRNNEPITRFIARWRALTFAFPKKFTHQELFKMCMNNFRHDLSSPTTNLFRDSTTAQMWKHISANNDVL